MNAVGGIAAIVAWLGAGFVLLAILYGLSRFLGRERIKRPELVSYGDVIELPAAAINAGGGARYAATGPHKRTMDRTHVRGHR